MAPLRSINHDVGSLLANADAVIGDAAHLEWVNQCIGPNTEQIAFVAPQDEVAYERELRNVVFRHRSDSDAIVVRLVAEDRVGDDDRTAGPIGRESALLAREMVAFEIVPSASRLASAEASREIALPRSGPLVNYSVVVTRARHQSAPISNLLLDQGAIPIVIPVIDIGVSEELHAALGGLVERSEHGSWVVFSSPNAVASVLESSNGRAILERSRIACIGPATMRRCLDAGLNVDFLPTIADAKTLVDEFPPPEPVASPRATFFASEIAGPVIEEGLTERGYLVERVSAYTTVEATVSPFVRHRARGADAIIFTSPSTVTGSIALFGLRDIPSRIVSIGPTTSAAVREFGLVLSAEARSRGPEALVDALVASISRPVERSHD